MFTSGAMSGTATPDWIAAAGSFLAAAAAIVLLFLAYRQMRSMKDQADAMSEQVRLMRAEAEEGRTRRAEEDSRRGAEQTARDVAIRGQIEAVAGIATATRDAARAHLQPVVFAHALGASLRGPNDDLDLAEGIVAFPYYLSNEGTGLAMNIRHGIEIASRRFEFGSGLEIRVLRPGEDLPPRDHSSGQLVHRRPLIVAQPEDALPPGWAGAARTYWARFENVFGEVFETQNPLDPRQSAAFMRLTDLGAAP